MSRKSIAVSTLRRAAKARRSSLYVWMLENHDTFRGVVKEAVRPNWEALAEMFAAQDLTDAEGNPPSAEVTRQTWWKVRKVVEARIKSAGQSKPAAHPQPSQGVKHVRSTSPLPDTGDEDAPIIEPRHRFHDRPAQTRFKPKDPT